MQTTNSYKKIIIVYLILIPLLQSCYTSKFFEGKSVVCYEFNKYDVTHQLILYPDKTFYYQLVGGLMFSTSQGNWHVNDNYIILNSFDEYKTGNVMNVQENYNDTINGYFIQAYDENNSPLSLGYLIFDNQSNKGTNLDEKGIGLWKDVINNSITVGYMADTYSYDIINKKANSFIFVLKLKDYGLYYLEDEKWKIKNKRILLNENGLIYKLKKECNK
jgi:hypothetical protein